MDAVVQKTLEKQYKLKLVRRIARRGVAGIWQAHSPEYVFCPLKISFCRGRQAGKSRVR